MILFTIGVLIGDITGSTEITIALIAAVPATIISVSSLLSAVAARKAAKYSREANDSVNNRHEKGGLTMYEMSAEAYKRSVHNSRILEMLLEYFRHKDPDMPQLDSVPKVPPIERPTDSIILNPKRETDQTKE